LFKRIKCSITINKKLNKLLEEVIEEKETTKSVLIENLLKEYIKNKNELVGPIQKIITNKL
jgi:metal-responsive CopG/Arc/MetJ family transcriptional regulator